MPEPIVKIYEWPISLMLYEVTLRQTRFHEFVAVVTIKRSGEVVACTKTFRDVLIHQHLELLARLYNLAEIRISRIGVGCAVLHRLVESGCRLVAKGPDGQLGFVENFDAAIDVEANIAHSANKYKTFVIQMDLRVRMAVGPGE